MKTISKQEADFQSVTKYIEKNPGTSKKAAIAAIAKMEGKSASTVLTNYYRAAKKNGAILRKKNTPSRRVSPKPQQKALDLNAVRASIQLTIDALEAENKKNSEIIGNLRKALI